jgi:phage FluMu protein Com
MELNKKQYDTFIKNVLKDYPTFPLNNLLTNDEKYDDEILALYCHKCNELFAEELEDTITIDKGEVYIKCPICKGVTDLFTTFNRNVSFITDGVIIENTPMWKKYIPKCKHVFGVYQGEDYYIASVTSKEDLAINESSDYPHALETFRYCPNCGILLSEVTMPD